MGDIKYEWTKMPKKAADFLKEYKLTKKINTRIEDLTPSKWFHDEKRKWESVSNEWNSKLSAWRNAKAKKEAAKAAKEAKKAKAAADKAAKEKKEAEEKEKAEKEGTPTGSAAEETECSGPYGCAIGNA